MKLFYIIIISLILLPAATLKPMRVDADFSDSNRFLQDVAEEGGAGFATPTEGENDLYYTVGRIINVALSLLGAILVILILYGGFKWMTAGGDPSKVEKAVAVLRNAVIGIVIVLAAFAISSFVLNGLLKATTT